MPLILSSLRLLVLLPSLPAVVVRDFLLGADETLDRIEQLVDIVTSYGNSIPFERRQHLVASDHLEVGQRVIAKSSINGGQWRNAIVMSTGQR